MTNLQVTWFNKRTLEALWNELKEICVDFVAETKENGYLSKSQRQAIIKLTIRKKKGKDKRFTQNIYKSYDKTSV